MKEVFKIAGFNYHINWEIIYKLVLMSMVPVIITGILVYIRKKYKLQNKKLLIFQIITGILFGIVACFGTQYGVDVGGATANARDAAILSAGMIFGGPAGIIAGTIGGVHRWLSVYWGVGSFTRLACSVACIIAGFFGTFLRKYLFDNKNPWWISSLFMGMIMEVLHINLLFFTNTSEIIKAISVIEIVTIPMISVNSIGIAVSSLVAAIVENGYGHVSAKNKSEISISTITQVRLRWVMIMAMIFTSMFTFMVQNLISMESVKEVLDTKIKDVIDGIEAAAEYDEEGEQRSIEISAAYQHVGALGYMMIVDKDGYIVSSASDITNDTLFSSGIYLLAGGYKPGEIFSATVNGVDSFCMYAMYKSYKVVAVYPISDAMFTRDAMLYINAFLQIIIFGVLFLVLYFLIRKLVIDNIIKVNAKLKDITDGNLDVRIDANDNQEFCSLSDYINNTVSTMQGLIEREANRIDQELEYAKNIQAQTLPSIYPHFAQHEEYKIFAEMHTAKEVGGDFYDFYYIDKTHLVLLIADVSGKGIPAAMFMMRAKTMIRNFVESGLSVEEAMTEANNRLCEGNDSNMFVTVWLGVIDLESGHVEFVNAGHNFPLIRRGNNDFEFMTSRSGLVCAGMEGYIYKKQEFCMQPGDILVLYTDGVTESTDRNSVLYGDSRFVSELNAGYNKHLSMEGICRQIKNNIDEFVGDAPQFDDITIVVFKYLKGYNSDRGMDMREFDAKLDKLDSVLEFIDENLIKVNAPTKVAMQMDVAVEEIFVNIVNYAYDTGIGKAWISCRVNNESVTVRFEDEGKPFNPLAKADPDVTLPAEERDIGGLGIFMVKKTMDDVIYSYANNRNILTLVKSW